MGGFRVRPFAVVAAAVLLSQQGVGRDGVSATKLRPWYAWPDINPFHHNAPSPRASQTMLKAGDDSLWVFGGEKNGVPSGDLYKLDTVSKQWTKMAHSSKGPTGRSSHAAVAVGDDFYVYGGLQQTPMRELWSFSTQTLTFTLLDSTKGQPVINQTTGKQYAWSTADYKPGAKAGHAMAAVGPAIYMFGGYSRDSTQRSNELWMMSTEDLTWHLLNPPSCFSLTPPGSPPSVPCAPALWPLARTGHAMTNVGRYLYLHGGQTGQMPDFKGGSADFSKELWRFDTQRRVWALLSPLDEATAPGARLGHAMSTVGQHIYIHGGFNASQSLADLWRLNVYSRGWALLDCTSSMKRGYHGMALVGTEMYLHAGLTSFDPLKVYSDELWKLSTPQTSTMKLCSHPSGTAHVDPHKPDNSELCCEVPTGRYGYGTFADVALEAADCPGNNQISFVSVPAGCSAVAYDISKTGGGPSWTIAAGEHSTNPSQTIPPPPAPQVPKAQQAAFTDNVISDIDFSCSSTPTFQWMNVAETVKPDTRPSMRNSHTMVPVGTSVYLFGGSASTFAQERYQSLGYSDELWRLSTEDFKWTSLVTTGAAGAKPAGRGSHAMAVVSNDIYLHGGTTNASSTSDDLWKLSTLTLVWTPLDSTVGSTKPSGRHLHAMVAVGTNVYLHGGFTGSVSSSELWLLSTVPTHSWKLLSPSGSKPSGRHAHTMTVVNDLVFLFGGVTGIIPASHSNTDEGYYLVPWRFNTTAVSWSMLSNTAVDSLPSPPMGSRPFARSHHSMVSVGTDIYIHGGCKYEIVDNKVKSCSVMSAYQECWLFSTMTLEWILLDTRAAGTPSQRYLHAMATGAFESLLCMTPD
jgi:N-acetylneuraminic acid mutarotase